MENDDNRREPTTAERERANYYAQKWLIPMEQVDAGERTALVKQITEQEWDIPHSRRRNVSESTLWRLFGIYQEQDMKGLYRKPRESAGQPRVLPRHILERAIEIRVDKSSRSVYRIMKVLEKEYPLEMEQVKASTLSHALTAAGHPRVRPRRDAAKARRKERHIHMRWELPLQLVQSDVCGTTLWVTQDGKLQKVYLIAVLDHCSKLCLHAEWFLAARLPALEKCTTQCLLIYGIFERLHVDNGKIYASYLLRNVCSELHIKLIFAGAYYPAGKGGIERFWQTAAEFFEEVGDSTRFNLAELNRKFAGWLHEYNRKEHSVTGEAPLERYQRLMTEPRLPDPVKLRTASLLREQRTVDKSFCCVNVRCREFSVHPSLRGQRVEVRYDPFVLDEVLVYSLDGTRLLQRATPALPNEKPGPFLPAEPAHRTPQIDVLSMLEEDRERDLKLKPASTRRPPRKSPSFTSFCQQVGRLLMRESDLDTFELSLLKECWERYGPLAPEFVSLNLEPLIAQVGHQLHLEDYLNVLVSAHLSRAKE